MNIGQSYIRKLKTINQMDWTIVQVFNIVESPHKEQLSDLDLLLFDHILTNYITNDYDMEQYAKNIYNYNRDGVYNDLILSYMLVGIRYNHPIKILQDKELVNISTETIVKELIDVIKVYNSNIESR